MMGTRVVAPRANGRRLAPGGPRGVVVAEDAVGVVMVPVFPVSDRHARAPRRAWAALVVAFNVLIIAVATVSSTKILIRFFTTEWCDNMGTGIKFSRPSAAVMMMKLIRILVYKPVLNRA
jgi:hypothetical protein